jgi:hypothetical protein
VAHCFISLYPILQIPSCCSLSVQITFLPTVVAHCFISLYPVLILPYCCSLSVHITFLPTVVANCFSFPLSNSTVTVLLFAISTHNLPTHHGGTLFHFPLSNSKVTVLLFAISTYNLPTDRGGTLFQFPSIQFCSYRLAVRYQYTYPSYWSWWHIVSLSLYPIPHLPSCCSLSVHITFLPNVVAQCFSFPLSNSTITLLLFAISTHNLPTHRGGTLFQFPSIQFYIYRLALHYQYT